MRRPRIKSSASTTARASNKVARRSGRNNLAFILRLRERVRREGGRRSWRSVDEIQMLKRTATTPLFSPRHRMTDRRREGDKSKKDERERGGERQSAPTNVTSLIIVVFFDQLSSLRKRRASAQNATEKKNSSRIPQVLPVFPDGGWWTTCPGSRLVFFRMLARDERRRNNIINSKGAVFLITTRPMMNHRLKAKLFAERVYTARTRSESSIRGSYGYNSYVRRLFATAFTFPPLGTGISLSQIRDYCVDTQSSFAQSTRMKGECCREEAGGCERAPFVARISVQTSVSQN